MILLWMINAYMCDAASCQRPAICATIVGIASMIYMIGPLKTYNEIELWDLLPVGHTRVAPGRSYTQNFIIKFRRSGQI